MRDLRMSVPQGKERKEKDEEGGQGGRRGERWKGRRRERKGTIRGRGKER